MKSFLFQKKKVKIETLGEYLHDARSALKLSVGHVRRLTSIPERFLEALEGGEYQSLPADVYVKGFLKSLASVYGADPNQLLEQYERERGLERSLQSDPLTPRVQAPLFPSGLVITPRVLTLTLVILGTLGSIGYLVWQVRSVAAPPKLLVDYPANDTTVNSRNILLRGSSEAGARVFVNSQEVPVDESGYFREVINLLEGSNNLQVKATNRFGKTNELLRTVIVVIPPGEVVSGQATTTPNNIKLQIRIGPKDTWLKVVADGKVKTDQIVAAGQVFEFSADKELTVSCGNAASTHIIYNGQDLGSLGSEGEVLSNIRFTTP